jgi:ABC-type thiamin/hydroxymethylpyrimidine transport system permease subunit
MNVVLTVLAVLLTFLALTTVLFGLLALPSIIAGYKQRRLDEHYLANALAAQVKANRHRSVK